jgi:hypothetical protein
MSQPLGHEEEVAMSRVGKSWKLEGGGSAEFGWGLIERSKPTAS